MTGLRAFLLCAAASFVSGRTLLQITPEQNYNPVTVAVTSAPYDIIATPITPSAPYSQAAYQCNVTGDSRFPPYATGTYPLTVSVPAGQKVRVIFANGNLNGATVTQQGEPGVIVQQGGAVIVQQSGYASPIVQPVGSPVVQQKAPPAAYVVQQSPTVVQQYPSYTPSTVVQQPPATYHPPPTETHPPPTETHPPPTETHPPPTETHPPETPYPTETHPPETPYPTETHPPKTPYPTETHPPETPYPTETHPPETPTPTETHPPETPYPTETHPPETPYPTETHPPETPTPTETHPPETPTPTETQPSKGKTPKPDKHSKTPDNPSGWGGDDWSGGSDWGSGSDWSSGNDWSSSGWGGYSGRRLLQETVPGGPNNGLVEYVALSSSNSVPGFVVPNTQFGVPYVEFTASEAARGQTASFAGVLEVALVVGGVPQYPFTPNKALSPECQVNVNFVVQ